METNRLNLVASLVAEIISFMQSPAESARKRTYFQQRRRAADSGVMQARRFVLVSI